MMLSGKEISILRSHIIDEIYVNGGDIDTPELKDLYNILFKLEKYDPETSKHPISPDDFWVYC